MSPNFECALYGKRHTVFDGIVAIVTPDKIDGLLVWLIPIEYAQGV